ncbi:hypothetical protein BURPSS13_H0148 [Burkholderia pseudomallei S13]|nr:hypothetical protein BURPSS13_H0148 [Burkholderia pseudomallei S13]
MQVSAYSVDVVSRIGHRCGAASAWRTPSKNASAGHSSEPRQRRGRAGRLAGRARSGERRVRPSCG